MSDPTDTPSTDGAPEPEEVIADLLRGGDADWSPSAFGEDDPAFVAGRILAALAAAGLRVVPEDRPAPCPYCNDDGVVHTYDGIVLGPCDCPAGVPALDDDTRREVERIVEHLRQDVDVIDQGAYEDMAQVSRAIDRAADLLAAAYLGGTER